MAEYKVIDDFQVKSIRVLSLEKPLGLDTVGKSAYIDGKKYKWLPNSVQQWILLPDVYESFEGKTVVFK